MGVFNPELVAKLLEEIPLDQRGRTAVELMRTIEGTATLVRPSNKQALDEMAAVAEVLNTACVQANIATGVAPELAKKYSRRIDPTTLKIG